MPQDDFVMRGNTAKGVTEILNFGGHKLGYAFIITEFQLYPSTNIGNADAELTGIIAAGKTSLDPDNPDFNNASLIACALFKNDDLTHYAGYSNRVINDTFLITQDLRLTVSNTEAANINWQIKFRPVKMSGPEEAVANYKQFTISDGS